MGGWRVEIHYHWGAGFIGSVVIRHVLCHTQDSVVNVDKLTYVGNLESLAEVANSPRFAFEQADICDRATLTQVFRLYQLDAVIHLAAESHVDRSIDGPAAFIETNIVGTYTLLDVAIEYWKALPDNRYAAFRFPTSLQMRCLEIWAILMCCLPKLPHIRQARPTQRARREPIIWCVPRNALTAYRCC